MQISCTHDFLAPFLKEMDFSTNGARVGWHLITLLFYEQDIFYHFWWSSRLLFSNYYTYYTCHSLSKTEEFFIQKLVFAPQNLVWFYYVVKCTLQEVEFLFFNCSQIWKNLHAVSKDNSWSIWFIHVFFFSNCVYNIIITLIWYHVVIRCVLPIIFKTSLIISFQTPTVV